MSVSVFNRRSWPWLAVFIGLFLVVFHRFWSHTIIGYDAFNFFAPNKTIWLRGLREGTIYAWNPWLSLGLPFIAVIEAGAFYPLNLVFLLFDFGVAHRLFILLHYPVAAYGMFLWLRQRGLDLPATLAGAAIFSLSGFLVSEHVQVQILLGSAWAPGVFYLASRAEAEWRFAAAAGAGLALQVLAGDPMTAAVTATVAGGGLVVAGFRGGRPLRGAGLLLVMGASSFLLSAAQVLPTWEMMGLSLRANGLPYSQMVQFSFHPAQLAGLVWPTPYGLTWPFYYYWGGFMLDADFSNLPWTASNYLGLPALLLAATGLAAGRRPLRWWLLGGTVFFLLLALGRHAPLYRLLAHVPVFNAFRYPSKYGVWLTLCLAGAAALGVERGLQWLDESPARVARAGLVYLAATVVAAAVAWFAWPALMAAKSPHPVGSPAWDLGAQHLAESWAQWTCVNLLAGLGLFLAGRRALGRAPALAGLGLIILADLYLGNVTIMPYGPADTYALEPLAARAIRAEGDPFGRGRVYRQDWEFRDRNPARRGLPRLARQTVWERLTLQRNHSAMSGIEDATLYGSYELRNGLKLFSHGLAPQVLALFNVRYLVQSPDAKPIESVPTKTICLDPLNDFRVDRLQNIWPRAYFVPGARPARDEDQALALLGTVDLTREVVITGGPAVAPAVADAPGVKAAQVVSYEPDRVELLVDAPSAGWLVLNDRFYPGWKATVDGALAEIRRANVLVRAVPVAAGRRRVVFVYRPLLLRVGRWISVPAWIGLIALFVISRGRRRREEFTDEEDGKG